MVVICFHCHVSKCCVRMSLLLCQYVIWQTPKIEIYPKYIRQTYGCSGPIGDDRLLQVPVVDSSVHCHLLWPCLPMSWNTLEAPIGQVLVFFFGEIFACGMHVLPLSNTIFETPQISSIYLRCSICSKAILGPRFRCIHCLDYNVCPKPRNRWGFGLDGLGLA